MQKTAVLRPLFCTAILIAATSVALAGTYGDEGEAEETPAAPPAPVMAEVETEEGWSFVITPQLWIPHVDTGGFAGGSTLGVLTVYALNTGQGFATTEAGSSEPVDTFDLQWGFQLAARKGRLAIGASYQNADFETRTAIIHRGDPVNFIPPIASGPGVDGELNDGDVAADEFVNTERHDADLAATYTFPEVIPRWLDLSVGLGLKAIYAESNRNYANLHPVVAAIGAIPPPGLYDVCEGDQFCSGGESFSDRVKTTTWTYGAIFPLTANLRLSDDAKWMLPINVSPFVGAETRDDEDVVYAFRVVGDGSPTDPFRLAVDREDGTFFAYGVTSDIKLTWGLTDYLMAYLGVRVQYMNGDSPNSDAYLAYGPLLGVSASFTPN